MSLIDRQTVLGIHLRAPSASRRDQDDLRTKFNNQTVFCAVSQDDRDLIQRRILCISGLIPSFDSFFNDCNYLESISDCIKWLIPGPWKGTLRRTMEDHFLGPSKKFYRAYCSLAIFSMRFYDDMPKQPVLKDPLAHAIARPDKAVLREFAKCALSLGFRNYRIVELSKYEADLTSDTNFTMEIQKPLLVSNGPKVAEKRRSGRPHRLDFKCEQSLLSFEYLDDRNQQVGQEVTPFFIRRVIYQNFFGRSSSTLSNSHQNSPRSASDHGPARSASNYSRASVSNYSRASVSNYSHARSASARRASFFGGSNAETWSISGSASSFINNAFGRPVITPKKVQRKSRLSNIDEQPEDFSESASYMEYYTRDSLKRQRTGHCSEQE